MVSFFAVVVCVLLVSSGSAFSALMLHVDVVSVLGLVSWLARYQVSSTRATGLQYHDAEFGPQRLSQGVNLGRRAYAWALNIHLEFLFGQ